MLSVAAVNVAHSCIYLNQQLNILTKTASLLIAIQVYFATAKRICEICFSFHELISKARYNCHRTIDAPLAKKLESSRTQLVVSSILPATLLHPLTDCKCRSKT